MTTAIRPSSEPARQSLPAGWRIVRLGDLFRIDRAIVPPGSAEASRRPYLSLEHVESVTGRILRTPDATTGDEGRSAAFAFDSRHVLYGKLRPYLNKVALPTRVGRCTTELLPLLPNEGVDRTYLALLLRRRETVSAAMNCKTGTRMPRANVAELFTLPVALPPLADQRRIVGAVTSQLEIVTRARSAVLQQIDAAALLAVVYLRDVFDSLAESASLMEIGSVATLKPSRSILNEGESEVLAVTTACLTEFGFDPRGVKVARMRPSDVTDCIVAQGEVLVARSNTPDLVGRAAMYEGEPANVVASDLTIRLEVGPSVLPRFLAAYLAHLYSTGYWRDRAGGASGSMKKITRAQIHAQIMPLPSIDDQRSIVGALQQRMATSIRLRGVLSDQLQTIEVLAEALHRVALTPRPFASVTRKLPKGIYFKRGAIASYVIQQLHKQPTFGRVQFEKLLYLTECHVGIDLAGSYKREAAGPLDAETLNKLENIAKKERWFTKHARGAEGYFYRPGTSIMGRVSAAKAILGDKQPIMDALIALFAKMNTEQAEVVTTLFAAWNDYLIDGYTPDDSQIIDEVRSNWHLSKERFAPEKLQQTLDWMRRKHVVPTGIGPHTEVTIGG